LRTPAIHPLDGFLARGCAYLVVFWLRSGASSAGTQPGNTPHYAWDHSEPKRVRWVARNRILTGTCNGRVNLSPLRSSHKLLLEAPRRRMAQDANEPRLRNGLWQIVPRCRESIVWCCDAFSGDYLLHNSDARSTPCPRNEDIADPTAHQHTLPSNNGVARVRATQQLNMG
jgi:hypothetical protein